MIQELRIKNYLSFRDEVTLSFEATNDRTFRETHTVAVSDKVRLNRVAIVYGANASGKSNLLLAIDFLRRFWFAKHTDIDEPTGVTPFLFDTFTAKEPTEFTLLFYVEKELYRYYLKLTPHSVLSEKLGIIRKGRTTGLFSRTEQKSLAVIKFNKRVVAPSRAVEEAIQAKCLRNTSVIAARNQVNCALPLIDDALKRMKTGIMPLIAPNIQMMDYAGKAIAADNELKQYLLDFLNRADFNIANVECRKTEEPIPELIKKVIKADDSLTDDRKEAMLAQNIEHTKTTFTHRVTNARGRETYTLTADAQSEGTKRMLGVEAAIYRAISRECILPVDEIESSLHPELVEYIIEQFLKAESQSQLIITTHYDPLLNTADSLIRRDSVWFTEKNPDGNSSLYCLTDFKGINKIKKLQQSYRNGCFGALPLITD